MKTFHILNGDCLDQRFPTDLNGEKIIWRECLVDGPVSETNFFESRTKFIQESFGETKEGYSEKVLNEFEKIKNIPQNADVYFWFEDDLFCQVNLWFLLSNISSENQNLFAVFPTFNDEKDRWKGFGNHDAEDLKRCFAESKKINSNDLELGQKLWKAFSKGDLQKLKIFSKSKSEIFRKLKDVSIANENRFNGNLDKQISELANQESDVNKLFQKFTEKYGIYGFGDLQFKRYFPQP